MKKIIDESQTDISKYVEKYKHISAKKDSNLKDRNSSGSLGAGRLYVNNNLPEASNNIINGTSSGFFTGESLMSPLKHLSFQSSDKNKDMDSIKIKVCSSNNGEKNSEPVIQPSKSQQQVRPYLNFFKTTSINEKMIKDTTASKLLLRDKLSITINTPKNLLINQKPKLSRHNFRNNISSSKDPNLTFSKKLSRN